MMRFQDQCPKCGSHLLIREGERGDFLACPRFPACKYTKPLPDGDLKIYQPPSPYCKKCHHTGLVPFVNKDGKVSHYAQIFCECRQSDPEYSTARKPEDFDFPMSYSVYRSLCQQHGWNDPGNDRPPELEEEVKPQEVIHRHINYNSDVSMKQWDKVNQLRGQVIHLQNKLNEHTDASKQYGKEPF